MTVAMAFNHFANQKVDIAIIETGLGGRLDSTNLITPILSVITNISIDHKEILGNTITKIATEKGGIIKKGVPVIIGERRRNATNVFKSIAASKNAEITFAEEELHLQQAKNSSPLHQTFDVYRNRELLYKSTAI